MGSNAIRTRQIVAEIRGIPMRKASDDASRLAHGAGAMQRACWQNLLKVVLWSNTPEFEG